MQNLGTKDQKQLQAEENFLKSFREHVRETSASESKLVVVGKVEPMVLCRQDAETTVVEEQ